MLVGSRDSDGAGRRRVLGASRHACARRVGAAPQRDGRRRRDQARTQSAQGAPRPRTDRPPRSRRLCRARHHDRRAGDPARRETRRLRSVFCHGAGARLGEAAMSGRLAVVGLGPGDVRWLTPEADAALAAADALFGYGPYLDRAPVRDGQSRHPSDNREEALRARAALETAAAGTNVALVSGGDPGGFVIALYNPISRARPWQLAAAFERLRRYLPATTPTVFGRAVGRADENVAVTTLQAADPAGADMATVVIVGSAETRLVPRPGHAALVYTPRSASA